jgi:hypothetical protein
MPPEQQNNFSPTPATTENPSGGHPVGYQPSKEEIEHTMKIMHDSLSQRKKKGFLDTIKEWFG